MVRLVLIVEVHGRGRIVEHCQQILLHVPHRGGVFCQRIQHKTDVVGVQLFQPTAYHFGRLVISGDSQHLAFGGTGVHKQVHDLIDGVLLVRAEPEQKLDLQGLRKIILKLLQNCAFDSIRIAVWAILYLRFAPVRVKATSQLGAGQGFSVLPFCLTSFFENGDKKRPPTFRIVRPVNGLIFGIRFFKLAGGEQHFILFADGKFTRDSRISVARECSPLDGRL